MNRSTPFRTAPVIAPNLISRSLLPRSYPAVLLALALAFFAFPQMAPAVTPPPDGGYAGNNTAEGDNALFSLTTGTDNTATGFQALFSNTSGSENTANGSDSLLNNSAGQGNTAIGYSALLGNASGNFNTATGTNALLNNNASDNTATGTNALFSNTTGSANTANGTNALKANTIGNRNTATGQSTLLTNGSGVGNTATGFQALVSNTVGSNNTANAVNTLKKNTTGNNNMASGVQALFNNTTGSSNIALGFNAGFNLTTGNNNIDIGNTGVAGDANIIRLGTVGTQTATFIGGIRGTSTANANAVPVVIDSAGQLGTVSSSRRFKDAIKPMDNSSEAILGLKPVTFHYKTDKQNTPQFGLIAEEVAKVNPDLVVRDDDGEIYTVRYEAVNAMLLNEFLKEHQKVEEQGETIAQMKKQIEALTATVQKVSDQVALSKPAPQLVANP
jgi:Chaperone of endosialidase